MQRPVALISAGKRLPICVLSWKFCPDCETATTMMWSRPTMCTPSIVTSKALADAIEHRLGQIVEPVAPEPVPREREHARLERIALGVGIEGDELLGDQRAQHVEAGARHQAQLARDRLHAERRIALAEQAQHRRRARDGGRLAGLHGLGELAVRCEVRCVGHVIAHHVTMVRSFNI